MGFFLLGNLSNLKYTIIMTKIMTILLRLTNWLLFFVRPDKTRIQFLTNEFTTPQGDFKTLIDQLTKDHYNVHFYGVHFKGSLKDKIHYAFACMVQLYLCRKSAVVVLNDNNFTLSVCKPAHLKVLQIWHATGAVKKFGEQLPKHKYQICGYDKVLCCGKYWKQIFAQAFNVPDESVIDTGLPCTDELIQRDPKPQHVVSYLPTFRGTSMDGIKWVDFDEKRIQSELPNGWKLATRYHPLLPLESNTAGMSLNDVLGMSDIIITDYSSVMFDASLLKDRTILIYAPDYEEYKDTVGYNIDLEEEFKGYSAKDEDSLVKLIKESIENPKPNTGYIQEKYVTHTDGHNTERVLEQIKDLLSQ